MAQTKRFVNEEIQNPTKEADESVLKEMEKQILLELADELLQDNYGSLRFRQLLAHTDIVDTGLRWQISNEITRRLVQHVLDKN